MPAFEGGHRYESVFLVLRRRFSVEKPRMGFGNEASTKTKEKCTKRFECQKDLCSDFVKMHDRVGNKYGRKGSYVPSEHEE